MPQMALSEILVAWIFNSIQFSLTYDAPNQKQTSNIQSNSLQDNHKSCLAKVTSWVFNTGWRLLRARWPLCFGLLAEEVDYEPLASWLSPLFPIQNCIEAEPLSSHLCGGWVPVPGMHPCSREWLRGGKPWLQLRRHNADAGVPEAGAVLKWEDIPVDAGLRTGVCWVYLRQIQVFVGATLRTCCPTTALVALALLPTRVGEVVAAKSDCRREPSLSWSPSWTRGSDTPPYTTYSTPYFL